MVNLGNFNPNEHETQSPSEFDLLKPGWYAMQVIESEQKTSAKGNPYLSLTFEMVEADHPEVRGRRVWVNLSLWGPSAKAKEIANSQLAQICKALGVQAVGDTEELHHRPLAVKISIKKGTNGYADQNNAQTFDAYAARFPGGAGGGQAAPAPAAPRAQAPAPAAQSQGQAAPPWGG